jgi:hypothetical protein
MSIEFILTALLSAVVGILISRYYAARIGVSWDFERRKILDPIGGGFPAGITINLDGHEIDNLIEMRLGIWNSGNQPIKSENFIGPSVFTFSVPNCRILKVQNLIKSREIVELDTEYSGDTLTVKLSNVMDSGDYFLTTIYAKMLENEIIFSKNNRPKLSIEIAGMPGGATQAIKPVIVGWKDAAVLGSVFLFYMFTGITFLVSGLYGLGYKKEFQKIVDVLGDFTELNAFMYWIFLWQGAISLVFCALLLILLVIGLIYRAPENIRREFYSSKGLVQQFFSRSKSQL